MANRGLIYSNPNLLINSDGSNPLDQEGTLPATSVTSGDYVCDGWYVTFDGTPTVDVAVQTNGGTRVTMSGGTGGTLLD